MFSCQPEWQRSVFLYRQLGKKLTVLEHEAELFTPERAEFIVAESAKRTSIEMYATRRHRKHAGQTVEK
ncbi:hypothetical protein GCM10010269_48570 [Streptomyces humidus]|uniref:Uncharacterized protein n=1 Tax=Streptomyces humidus TaxID=52259 RepID=A0A918L567_9ACTN|nr:hypothetical protein GCM10010269_48570 [Streptomyces humidus]